MYVPTLEKHINLIHHISIEKLKYHIIFYRWQLEKIQQSIIKREREYFLSVCLSVFLSVFLSFFFFLSFLLSFLSFKATPEAYGGSQARGRIQLSLPAHATATATPDPSHICDPYHSSWRCSQQCQILNPLSGARDRNCILMDTSQIRFPETGQEPQEREYFPKETNAPYAKSKWAGYLLNHSTHISNQKVTLFYKS